PGAGIEQLGGRVDGARVFHHRDVPQSRRRPARVATRQLGAARPVEREAGLEQRYALGAPVALLPQRGGEARAHAAGMEMLDRYEYEARVREVIIREDH